MELLFGVAIGLVVGWFLLPAPQFVTDFWNKLFSGGDSTEV